MKKLLVIAHVWPEPQSSAAGGRLVHLLDLLGDLFQERTVASAAEKGPYSHDFSGMDVSLVPVQLNDPSFDAFLRELQPDVVLFDRFMAEEQFGWRVREVLSAAMTILDTEDLHFLRQARGEAVRKNQGFTDDLLYSALAKREVASILRCDLSLIISETEQQLLRDKMQVPASLLYFLPLLTKENPSDLSVYSQRKHFLFIGNGFHDPNLDAVETLKKEVWPRVRKQLPEAELHIYGAYLPEKVMQLHNPAQGFLVKGRAEEVSHVMQQARVFLAPLRFGAGQKGKLLEAMLYGLPAVTTGIGAESMNGELDWPGTITDNWDEFTEAAVDLYQDEKQWNKASEQGKVVLDARFRTDLFREKTLERIRIIHQNLEKHRHEHFIGQILQINALNSYKYLSRWIEEKNKAN